MGVWGKGEETSLKRFLSPTAFLSLTATAPANGRIFSPGKEGKVFEWGLASSGLPPFKNRRLTPHGGKSRPFGDWAGRLLCRVCSWRPGPG